MKSILTILLVTWQMGMMACQNGQTTTPAGDEQTTVKESGQSNVVDTTSAPNVVRVAMNSKDHSTLVQAVVAGELVDALSNNGPFTVFAPTNEAFAALPAGTVDNLLKPQNKAALQNILQYHVWIGVLNEDMMKDGETINMVNMDNATLHVKDGKYMINDANIVGTVKASNGVVYVIDKVLLPPEKK